MTFWTGVTWQSNVTWEGLGRWQGQIPGELAFVLANVARQPRAVLDLIPDA